MLHDARVRPRGGTNLQDEGVNYRFQSISFSGNEGWIIGKPAILFHTTDAGRTWERIPLSARLPGACHLPLSSALLASQARQTSSNIEMLRRKCVMRRLQATRWQLRRWTTRVVRRWPRTRVPYTSPVTQRRRGARRWRRPSLPRSTAPCPPVSAVPLTTPVRGLIESYPRADCSAHLACYTQNTACHGLPRRRLVATRHALTAHGTLERCRAGSFASMRRSPFGDYVGVTQRGNFYMTWSPGQTFWQPHNRNSSRRIQNMGWREDGGLWLISRGGELYFGEGEGVTEEFEQRRIGSRGFGILDVGYKSAGEVWAAGGSGSLFVSTNQGESWKREKATDDLAANLYTVKFVNGGKNGFVLGNDGVLLRYLGA